MADTELAAMTERDFASILDTDWLYLTDSGGTIDRKVSVATIRRQSKLISATSTDAGPSNTAVETACATHTVPQGTWTGRGVRLTAFGDMLANNATVNLRIRTKFGATTIGDTNNMSIGTSANRAKWRIVVDIVFAGAASEDCSTFMSIRRDANSISVTGVFVGDGYSAATEDTSAASKDVVLTAQYGTAGSLTDFICRSSYLEWI